MGEGPTKSFGTGLLEASIMKASGSELELELDLVRAHIVLHLHLLCGAASFLTSLERVNLILLLARLVCRQWFFIIITLYY